MKQYFTITLSAEINKPGEGDPWWDEIDHWINKQHTGSEHLAHGVEVTEEHMDAAYKARIFPKVKVKLIMNENGQWLVGEVKNL